MHILTIKGSLKNKRTLHYVLGLLGVYSHWILAIIVNNYRYEEITKGKGKAKEPSAAKSDEGKKGAGPSKGKGGTSKGKAKPSTSSLAAGDSDFYIPPQNKWPVKIVRFHRSICM